MTAVIDVEEKRSLEEAYLVRGLTVREIAVEAGVSYPLVWRRLRRNGVTMRPARKRTDWYCLGLDCGKTGPDVRPYHLEHVGLLEPWAFCDACAKELGLTPDQVWTERELKKLR